MDSTPSQTKRRSAQKLRYNPSGAPFKLQSLPRFHPAVYGLISSPASSTPSSQGPSQQPPMPPWSQQHQLSDAQRQLYFSQYETLTQAAEVRILPDSPKLTPMADSPGPVTPLELGGECYLTASSNQKAVDVEEYINEANLRKEPSPRQGDALGSRRKTV